MIKQIHHYDTIVIGGGQAGLGTGYYLKQHGNNFVILDANQRIGDVWRNRWDSLRLFTPNRYNALPGMPFPAPAHTFPTKDEMGDYLETYARRFDLPVQTSSRVDSLSKHNGRFNVTAGDERYEADNVVVAMANYQCPAVPEFATQLNPAIRQLHSSEYRNPSQLQDGDVLIVGAGNSGVEIALDIADKRRTWLSGQYPGHIPFRIDRLVARFLLIPFVLGFIFYHVMHVKTPIGRRVRPKRLHGTAPLVRTKPSDVTAAGVEQVPRTVGVGDGLPLLEDGRLLDVANIIWCTGFHPGFSWIDLPVFDEQGDPMHERGIVHNEPGLYFVGLHFLTSISSAQINGIARDAKYVVQAITSRN
ncbi:MAG: portal protein [Chloroflexi bacterium]|nr:MAG: portal protein [Phototrophicales bacterium]RMF82390.1 MAG: portal protein [Chloroflexota bacterium]